MNKNTKRLSDKDVEKAWKSLENEPFITNDNGEQVLDSENGWFGFEKGTTQQEIWRWFDTHHSKGVAYLVNDYEPEETQNRTEKKNTEKKLSTRERIIELFDNAKMTVTVSNGKDVFSFNDLLKSYEEKSGTIGTTLANAVSTMISENRKPSDYYSLSPAVFDSEGNAQSKDGYNVRMSLCENAAWEIINNPEISTMQNVEDFMQKKSEELRNEYYKHHNLEIDESRENEKTLTWNNIQENADGAHWNDDALAVKNRAKEQAVQFAEEIGAEINADDEDDIESFVKDYGISFWPDGTMSENRYVLTSGNPQVGHDYGIQSMLAKFLEEESEENASDNREKEFTSNFSRERFADGDLRTIISYANHLDDGSAQWMLGAKAGGERQLYYRDPTQFGEWQKATSQEFFDFVGDFYAHNYDIKNELDKDSLSLMRQLFPNSKDIEKFWEQYYTKDDMTIEDVNDLSDHSAHGEIWSYLPDIDDGNNPYVILENAVEEAASYLENNDGLKDKDFGNRSDSTEEEKATRKEFLSLLKNANDALHSDEFHDNAFPIENATAENLDLLHAEVLKDCAALAKEDFLSSFGEIIDGEYPNQEEAEYRRHTLNELRIDEKNLNNYLDDNATRLLENVYEKARTKSVGLYDFIEATVDTSSPTDEQEMEWNRVLEELLDGYTDYKDFNEKWDVSLTPATAKLHWLESEKDLIHIAFDNALGNDSVEVPYGAENYKNFLDSIDFEKRFSHSNLLRAETLQMSNAKVQERDVPKDKDMERISAIFAGMEAPDMHGNLKDIEGLVENYRNTDGVKVPVAEAISTMLYDSPQIHKNGSYDNFGTLSMENFDNKYEKDGTEARNELCDMVAVRIAADKSVKNIEQVKELLKIDSEKILKEKLDEIAHSKEFIEKFGDWEKANRIEKLKKSESLQMSGKIIVHGKDKTSYINELRSNPSRENLRKLTSIVTDFGKEMLQNLRFEQNLDGYASPVLTINDDGKKYHINFSGIKETSHHNLYQKGHIEGIYNIPQIIESAIYLTTEKNEDNRKPELKQFHYYSIGIKLDNDDYTAKIVFTENKNGEIYYDQSLSTIEKGKLIDLLQTKNKPTAVNPINRRDSNGLSENEPPSEYYDMRLASICQVPQMPYLEMMNGKWQPTQEAIKAVEDGKLSVEKNGQKYVMRDELLMEEKNMEKEDTFKISDAEMERLSKLFEGKTCLDSAGTKNVDFKSLVEDYKENKDPENALKDAISMMLHSNRDTEEYYNFSPSIFDSKNDQRDKDGYEMRWELCEKTAEQIIKDKTAKTMDDAETIMSWVSADMIKEYEKEEQREQEWPGFATWKELADIVGKDIYSFKDDVLESNEGISEKNWKIEALARTLNDGVLDLRGFDTESTSKINSLQYDSDFMKSSKGEVYKAINPEKWDVLTKIAESTVAKYSSEIVGTTVDTLQRKYDEELSNDHVYLEAVENGLVEIDKNMAERILDNNNPHTLQDGVKIAIVKASFEKNAPEWEKPERFIVTPHNSFPENYTDKELSDYLTDNRVKSAEPEIFEKQAGIISYYLMRNEYALYVDQKGNLNCVDFSEDFNLDDVGKVITNNELLKLTNDLIDKDIGFKNRAEEDFKEIKNLLNGYEKEQKIQKTQSPQELYDSFIGKVEKEFKELKLLRAATVNVIKELSQEDKSVINDELKKRGAKTPESLALVVKESIEKRNKNKTKEHSQKREKDYFERER